MSNTPLSMIRRLPVLSFRNELRGPFEDIFDNFFDKFIREFDTVQPLNTRRGYPKVDIYQEDNDLVFKAAVPGMKRDQLSIELEDGVLTIKGESQCLLKPIEDEEDEKYVLCTPYVRELKHSSFLRRFTIPSELDLSDIDKADAKLEDGILTIRFVDAYTEEDTKPKTKDIPIK